jgi:hypothetical protein
LGTLLSSTSARAQSFCGVCIIHHTLLGLEFAIT